MNSNPLSKDLNYILDHTTSLWEDLRDQALFITGGTGFFGIWLLESFLWANKTFQLNATATVLTRDISSFQKKCPRFFEESSLHFHEGDIRDFTFPSKKFSHIIHAATDASAALNANHPTLMFDTIVDGTKRTLELAEASGAKQFLFISSGAVYGRQPPELTHVSEDYLSLPDEKSAYALGKYAAEALCRSSHINIKIARCFAFVGPYLPLDIHFAIGNFIRDGLAGGPIQIGGDGSPHRSYLYAADLMIWLWTILFRGERRRPYNVGSDESFSIQDIALLVSQAFDSTIEIKIAKPPGNSLPERYVPNINRAREELGLTPRIKLRNAIQSTIHFLHRTV